MSNRLIVIVCCLFLASCNNPAPNYIEDNGVIFHTTYAIKYKHTHSLKAEIEKELAKFDDSLNPFKPTSIISKVNNNEEVVLDSFFVDVFKCSQEVSSESRGLFDITVSPLINAWGFGFKNMDNVSPQLIDSLKQLVGYEKLLLGDEGVLKADPRMQINMSAIAKGYAVDVVAALLESYGAADYMVEIGGEIRTKGKSARGECWNLGISKPINKNIYDYRNLQTLVRLCDKAMATSGNYRNYYIKDGKKFAHTINPNTGYPSETGILSATVIAGDCMTADAYATAFMLADTSLTRKIAEKEKLDYMLIIEGQDGSFATIKSPGFDSYMLDE